jgi:Tfp pilus assembly protein PilP
MADPNARLTTGTSRIAAAVLLLAAILVPAGAVAQTSPQGQQPTRTGPQAAAPAPAAGYSYDPGGRRDPFVSLVTRGSDLRSTTTRPDGVPGMLVEETSIRGIVASRGSYVAMVQGPDGKTYTIRAGDRLFDGVVRAVTADAVVFIQQVNDPLSLVKQREVRKSLRAVEEGK